MGKTAIIIVAFVICAVYSYGYGYIEGTEDTKKELENIECVEKIERCKHGEENNS